MNLNLLKNKEKLKINTVKSNTNDNEKTREKSSGRSMVEMLGVLAIIGVLSIGGIQGYTIAMRKYQANEILTALNKYATIIYSNCLSAQLNDDEEETYIDEERGREFLSCPNPISFLNAGIGGYPKGLINVGESGMHAYWQDPHPNIIRTNSGDIVRLYIAVENQELCKTIMNVAGIVPTAFGGTYDFDCGLFNEYYKTGLVVSFIMN